MSPSPMAAGQASGQTKQGKPGPALIVPFTRSAHEHDEASIDVSQILLAGSSTQLGPYDVPAYGFVRGLILNIDATGGVASVTVAAQEDAPWSALNEVVLMDVNGAPIVGPLGGYDLYLLNKYGGYVPHSPDPKGYVGYSAVAVGASASGNFAFQLRIPIEVGLRDALGSLANQNAASTFKVRITLAASTAIYSTAPNTTLPTVRVRLTLDAWTQPTAADVRGNPQAQLPPAHGTTSYWSKTVLPVVSGFNTLRLPRVGNYIRELILCFRDVGGTRATGETNWPDPVSLFWDTRLLKQYGKTLYRNQHTQRYDLTGALEATRGKDNGVYVEEYAHDFAGMVGFELRDLWLPTSQSTRLELQGTFGGAGSLTVITNDIAPNGEIFV